MESDPSVASKTGGAGRIPYESELVAGPFPTEDAALRWITQQPQQGSALAAEPIILPSQRPED